MDSRLDSALKIPICDLSTDIYQQLPPISKSSPLLAFFTIKVRLIKAHRLFSSALLNPFCLSKHFHVLELLKYSFPQMP